MGDTISGGVGIKCCAIKSYRNSQSLRIVLTQISPGPIAFHNGGGRGGRLLGGGPKLHERQTHRILLL